MPEAAVELDHETFGRVRHVADDRAPAVRRPGLASSRGESMSSLDVAEVTVLQHGVRTLGHVSQHGDQRGPALEVAQPLECTEQPRHVGPALLAGIGQHGDRACEVPLRGDLEQRHLDRDTGRPPVRRQPRGCAANAFDSYAGHGRGTAPRRVDDHPHRLVERRRPAVAANAVEVQRRLPVHRCRPVEEHGGPRPLLPGQWARVIDIHPFVDAGPLATPDHPPDVDVVPTDLHDLTAGDHP